MTIESFHPFLPPDRKAVYDGNISPFCTQFVQKNCKTAHSFTPTHKELQSYMCDDENGVFFNLFLHKK